MNPAGPFLVQGLVHLNGMPRPTTGRPTRRLALVAFLLMARTSNLGGRSGTRRFGTNRLRLRGRYIRPSLSCQFN